MTVRGQKGSVMTGAKVSPRAEAAMARGTDAKRRMHMEACVY